MSPVEFKKTLCRPVEFKGQGPHLLTAPDKVTGDRTGSGGDGRQSVTTVRLIPFTFLFN